MATLIGGLIQMSLKADTSKSPEQIRDAFRAAGYSPTQVQAYATAVEARIAQLQRL